MDKQPLTLRQAQAIRTKNRIYNAAISLMDEKGFNNTSIEEISKKAGVSVGAFYHYYKSKHDIFFETYKIFDDYLANEVEPLLTQDEAYDKIVTVFKYYARYNNNRGLDAVRQLYNTQNKFFIDKNRYIYSLLGKVIRAGQEGDELMQDMTPESIADYLLVMARGVIYDWLMHDAEYSLEEVMVEKMSLLGILFRVQKQ